MKGNATMQKQANSENCGPRAATNLTLNKVKCGDQGHGMMPSMGLSQGLERACHKDHACHISMLYHYYFRRNEPVKVFVTNGRTEGRMDIRTNEF